MLPSREKEVLAVQTGDVEMDDPVFSRAELKIVVCQLFAIKSSFLQPRGDILGEIFEHDKDCSVPSLKFRNHSRLGTRIP
ncbi:hypothetical protein CEXT_623131 [Caerostris extrusa]|uniref:Uncharacterized protein n=1 Tax=Caerostris extrusa TaxID=172846 RepID=A0AAV4WM78_CAEEX|nr:hypothetical protein CEXT_623131 [Caerostris extrusa]